jgi:hypothetical protein
MHILADSPFQYVEIDSHLAQTQYEAANTLEVGQVGFAAFQSDFQYIFIGNPYTAHFTYVYFDVQEPYLEGLLTDARLFLNNIPLQQTETEEFRLANLFAAINAAVASGEVTANDIQSIIDELESSGALDNSAADAALENFLYSDDGGGDAGDDFGAAETAPSEGALATAQAATATVVAGHAEAEDSSWIDRAVVATGAVGAVVVRPGERRARRRFLGLF